jgi:hypothetical protein
VVRGLGHGRLVPHRAAGDKPGCIANCIWHTLRA